MADPTLAELMQKAGVKAPFEDIVNTDTFKTLFLHTDKNGLDLLKRVVNLECGHQAITKNQHRVRCHQCHEMILNGEDYVSFRFPDGLSDD